MTPPNINMFFARLLVDRLVNEGVSLFIISPGSRSTPLTVAAAEHPDTATKIILDERTAAFYALGFARATGNAPALVCTSGTALANYYPALIEAFQSRLPLIVLSADRPEELQGVGANQTIQQANIYGEYAVNLSFEAPDTTLDPYRILESIEQAIQKTWVQGKAMTMPLHINCRFREPLAPDDDSFPLQKMNGRVASWYKNRPVDLTGYSMPDYAEEVESLAQLIAGKKRGIIVAGPESRYRHCPKLGELSARLKWPIVCDIQSQYRFSTMEIGGFPIGHFDLFLDHEKAAEELKPDLVLHFGGLPTSKRLNGFLASLTGIDYIKIQQHERTIDPDGLETKRIIAHENLFAEQLRARVSENKDATYLAKWMKTEYAALTIINRFAADNNINEITLPKTVIEIMLSKSALYLSSSMPVRDADSFMPVSKKAIQVGANRGASGIDGILASACGFSAGCDRAVTIIIGDLAFLHDIGSLKLIRENKKPAIVVVINNNGGGIFHFLPIARHESVFEEYFGTPHGLTFGKVGEMYGLPYSTPKSVGEFSEAYLDLLKQGRSGIIELIADRQENPAQHAMIRERVHEAVAKLYE
ncbi:MAG: 2-succinyl-5-enolpyruvyl-6-hydroxy-3-cyclohexene-1-carboxylic-acid synthase [Candidatus Zixiibacteriota bacterium]